MVFLENQRDGAKLEVENSPAEGHPHGEKEDDRLGKEHICWRVSNMLRYVNILDATHGKVDTARSESS